MGEVFAETLFELAVDTARIPDLSIVLEAKHAAASADDALPPFAPDIAVEIVSPNDKAMELERKVDQYKSAGVQEIWLVYTDLQFLRTQIGAQTRHYSIDQVLETPLLPGFQLDVRDLF